MNLYIKQHIQLYPHTHVPTNRCWRKVGLIKPQMANTTYREVATGVLWCNDVHLYEVFNFSLTIKVNSLQLNPLAINHILLNELL